MKRRLVSMCLAVMLVGGLSLSSMQEVRAAGNKVIDGSELTHDEESTGYDTKITRGEDLMTGYSKCTKLAEGKIYAGGTTIARHVVDSIQIAVLVERAKEEDTEWSYYDGWQKENLNMNRVTSNRTLYVEGDYYYRVRCEQRHEQFIYWRYLYRVISSKEHRSKNTTQEAKNNKVLKMEDEYLK